jgi:protein-S-isoprenylcysteine O-methyltransferase Ste14
MGGKNTNFFLMQNCLSQKSYFCRLIAVFSRKIKKPIPMVKFLWKNILRLIDGALYGFVGPFSVLYIIPQFIMRLFSFTSRDGFGFQFIKITGMILMWSGAALAIYCTLLMFAFGKGTPLVTSAPQKIIIRNIYKYIRHPMMWSLFIVVLGEALCFGQWILFIWLIAMSRIIVLIVVNYEEPQLERRFGESWIEYTKQVPRWLPRIKKSMS